jgi:hypothetical protein
MAFIKLPTTKDLRLKKTLFDTHESFLEKEIQLISLEPGTMFYVRGIYSKVAPA